MTFEAALERALAVSRRRSRVQGAGLLAASVLIAAVSFFVFHHLQGAAAVLLIVGGLGLQKLIWPSVAALERLRGGTPALWAPSASHGVVVVVGSQLLAGKLAVELDRHALHRVASVGYDEAQHALLVHTLRRDSAQDDARESTVREVIVLDQSVPPERGYALAKELLTLSLR